MDAASFLNDPSWNGGLCLAYDLGANTHLTVRRILEAPDGGVLVAGTVTQPALGGSDENWYVLKLNSIGGIDSGFGFFGIRVLAFNRVTRGTDRLSDLAVEPTTGALFLVGSEEVPDYYDFVGVLAKLTSSGNLDLAWGPGGSVPLFLRDGGFVLKSTAQSLAIDPLAGTIWVALLADSPTGDQLGIVGVTAAALLSDPIEFAWVAGTPSIPQRMLWQGDGRLLIAGSSAAGTLFAVTRFEPFAPTFAQPDPTYGTNGTATFEPGALGWGTGQQLCSATLSGGRVVVVGDSDRGDIDQLVVRFDRGLLFSDGFESFETGWWSATSP